MEFGRVDQLTDISFHLPDDNPANKLSFADRQLVDRSIYIGLTGWGEKAWLENIYPSGTKPNSFLRSYARSFNCVELNSTFYGIPTEQVINKWLLETPEEFRFFPKVWRAISHRPILRAQDSTFQVFIDMLYQFGNRVKASFLQLPPGFGPSRYYELESFIHCWPIEHRLLIEFRDRQWLENEPIMDLMKSRRVGLVITDVAGRRDLMHMRVLGMSTLIRFVACGDSSLDQFRLKQWEERLENWYSRGLDWIAFFCHEPQNGLAPALARMAKSILNQNDNFIIPKIKDILDYETTQKSIFETS